MNTIQTNYQALVTEENEVPHESVIFHAASEGGKRKWHLSYFTLLRMISVLCENYTAFCNY